MTTNGEKGTQRGRAAAGKRRALVSSKPTAPPVVTLLTDFGTADYFVGAMKGAILSVNPRAQIIDVTHDVPPQDVAAGAFTLLNSYQTFPAGTVHVAVVDPGVGSSRRALVVAARDQFFVGPDNGLLGYVIEREREARVYHLTNDEYFRRPVSATFHGRDVFAPIAGALSAGVSPDELGPEAYDFVRLSPLAPRIGDDGTLLGSIIHVDRFGNCVTNFTRDDLTEEMMSHGASLRVGGHGVKSYRRFYAEAGGDGEEPFAIWGSAGFLEVVVFGDSAARLLNVGRGAVVEARA